MAIKQEHLNAVRTFMNGLRFAEEMEKALAEYLTLEEQTKALERKHKDIEKTAMAMDADVKASEQRSKKRIAELADELALHQERHVKAMDSIKREHAEWAKSFQDEREAEMKQRADALAAVEKQHEQRMVQINRQFDDAVARVDELNKEIAQVENELNAAAKVKTQMKADLASLLK